MKRHRPPKGPVTNEGQVKVTVCPGYVPPHENPELFKQLHDDWLHDKTRLSVKARRHVANRVKEL